MIHIEPGTSVILPKKYHYQHNVCVQFYDLLVSLLRSKEFAALHSTAISLPTTGDVGSIRVDSEGEEILEFLRKNDRREETISFMSKHILTHVLSDFCNYIHESLRCARDGKMSVSYNLLRKPITDELLIFEQLLIERENFIDRFFYNGTPNLYDPSAGNHREAGLRRIITGAKNKLGMLAPMFGDLIYDLRYDKSLSGGLNAVMNHAHHIVTTDSRYRTEPGNLNFVFSVKEDYDRYWSNYYTLVPLLLLYTTAVVDRLVSELIRVSPATFGERELRRFLGLIFNTEKSGVGQRRASKPVFKALASDLTVKCRCGHVNVFERADFKLYFDVNIILCIKCFSEICHYKEFKRKVARFFPIADGPPSTESC
jgi:hypothetical protein